MELLRKKLSLIEWLAALNDESIINKVEEIRKSTFIKKYEDSLKPLTEDQLRKRIQASEDDIKYGRTSTLEDIEKESEN